MAITQDGYARNQGGGNQTAGSVTLSTTNAHDIIVLSVYNENNGHAGPVALTTPSSTNTTGWTQRSSTQSTGGAAGGGAGASQDVWYGKAATTLTNEVISFGFATQTDDWAAVCSGWSGVDQTTIWDTNGSLPATGISNAGVTAPSVTGISTSALNTVLLMFGGCTGNGDFTSPTSAPSGWSSQGIPGSTNGGRLDAENYGAYQIETAPQSGVTATFSSSCAGWIAVVDALRAAGQAVITKSSAALIGF